MKIESNIFLDSNILIHATLIDFDAEKYVNCSSVLQVLNDNENNVFISTQILREFYSIVTNSNIVKKPLTPEQANIRIMDFMLDYEVLPINNSIIEQLLILTQKYQIKGRKVHDTTIAATMIQNNIFTVMTYNKKDFENFKEIKVISPEKLLK
jgi:predicted nucleic acid-binding protein